ncbi:hypothetical protein HMPREF0731_4029, partial [Pseudoroseomonas cervicalis ATCC 49957]
MPATLQQGGGGGGGGRASFHGNVIERLEAREIGQGGTRQGAGDGAAGGQRRA